MTRALLLVAAAMFCASCRTENRLGPIQATSVIGSTTEMSDREDCLYREVARLLEPTGSAAASLHNIAVAATRFCSDAARARFQRASIAGLPDAQDLARDDQIRMEQRAFAIGLELREKRATGR
jgi:hypothetical protein